jgi:hypothetical protein
MGELEKAPTRARLQRAMVANAATKPVNVLVPPGMAVVAIGIGASWLIVFAVVVYALLVATVFFDEKEAARVADRFYGRTSKPLPRRRPLAAPIARHVDAAEAEQRRIEQAIASSDLPFSDLTGEVRRLIEAMRGTADRAQVVYEYLAQQDPQRVMARIAELERAPARDETGSQTLEALREQSAAYHDLYGQLNRYYAEMEHTVASLGAVHAQIVRASIAGEHEKQRELAGQVRGLREEVDVLSDGMREAYAQTES